VGLTFSCGRVELGKGAGVGPGVREAAEGHFQGEGGAGTGASPKVLGEGFFRWRMFGARDGMAAGAMIVAGFEGKRVDAIALVFFFTVADVLGAALFQSARIGGCGCGDW
jgi:hypothetical protein